ncbi:cytochrome P450 [Streptomyces sp. NPDC050658]|uniref:cytochrome P450 n=1 Tax=unclassified Streptomyces TaxID=2593676 RepID=UPI0034283DE7
MEVPTKQHMLMVCGHAEISSVLADPRMSRSAAAAAGIAATPTQLARQTLEPRNQAAHLSIRRALAPFFSPKQAKDAAPWIYKLAFDRLGSLIALNSPFDLVTQMARPLSMTVMSRLIGTSLSFMQELAEDADVVFGISRARQEELQEAQERLTQRSKYLLDQQGAQEDRSTLLGRLASINEAGGLTHTDISELIRGLLVVSWQEASRRISHSVLALSGDPAQEQLIRESPSRVEPAVEELLRFERYPTSLTPRLATEDVSIGDTLIPAGQAAIVSLYSANHDPLVFPEPDRLDCTRLPRDDMVFGFGMHYCPGTHLARTILRATMAALRQHPRLVLVGSPTWRHGWTAPTLQQLTVAADR